MSEFIVGARGHDFGRHSVEELLSSIGDAGFRCTQLAYTKAVEGVKSYADVTPELVDATNAAVQKSGVSIAVDGTYVELGYADEDNAFEEILDKKCFSATEEDWIKLGWLSDAGYVVSYSDHHAEVPRAVISLYKEINTPEFHKLCRQVSWMRSCQTMLGFIYAIAPLKIVYRMYRRRPEYKVNYDEFLKILEQVPENDNMCIVRDGKMIFKSVLQDNLYERIEEYQGDREFYMPSPEEVLDYAKHGYPSEDPSYKKLENFLREELHLNTVQVIELMYIVFKEFSMDGMLSDIMEEFNNKNVVFDSEKQTEEFAAIMMNVNNNTRMLDFRGYTPNEIARMSSPKASSAVMPSMVPMGSLASTPSFIPSNAATKKIYPNDPCPCGSGKKYKKCCGRK